MDKYRTKSKLSILSVDKITNGRRRSLLKEKSRTNRLYEQSEHTSVDSVLDITHDQELSVSDSESCTSNGNSRKTGLLFSSGNGLVKLQDEEQRDYNIVKKIFLSGLGSLANHTNVVSVQKNQFSSLSGQARLQSFQIFSNATTKKGSSSSANIKFAWYGTSKDGVDSIINHGFSQCERPEYGFGVYLSPESSSLDSAKSSIIDESGLRHMLLCRVILGNTEEVGPGSEQFHPSSEEFDSGVDNLISPKKYIVWSTHMNTHILPEYVVSFRAPPHLEEFSRIQEGVRKPKSAWLPFPTLISELSKYLPPNACSLIKKYHSDYRGKTIARQYLIRRLRQIAGDKLLISVIKSFGESNLQQPLKMCGNEVGPADD